MAATRTKVEVLGGLGDRAAEWDRLVERQPLASPFLRSWWLGAAAGGRPQVLCCTDAGRLIGGAAFELDVVGRGGRGLERVRSLGQGPLAPDHLDVIAEVGRGDEVLGHVLEWLRRPGNRIVDLDGLAADGALARALARHEVTRVAAPFASLPPVLDDYMADRPGQLRSTVTRSRKRLARAGATIRRVPSADAPAALASLERLHDHRWADESGFLDAWDRFERAALVGLDDGSVVIHEVVDGAGSVVATELDVRAGSTLAFYQAGRSTDREWRGAGSTLKAEVIAWAIGQGLTEYDLLRGDEPYKADWTNGTRHVVRVRLGVGPLGRTAVAAATAWWHARRWQESLEDARARRRPTRHGERQRADG